MKSRRRALTVLAAFIVVTFVVVAIYIVLVRPSSPPSIETYDWNIETVDAHFLTGCFMSTSVVTDSNNKIHICYYDYGRKDLKYATNLGGRWVNCTVDSTGDVGEYNSMAIDSNDKPHISYLDFTNGVIKHATITAGGFWTFETAVPCGDNLDVSSIAIDSKDRIYICYDDGYYPDDELKYALYAGGSWTYHTIASGCGGYGSIAAGSDDSIHVVYGGQGAALTYATNSSGTWTSNVLDDATCWSYSVALGAEDEIHVSYLAREQDGSNSSVRYASNENGTWTHVTVYDDLLPGDYTSFMPGTSIAVDSHNRTHIGFTDPVNWGAMYATNENGSWRVYTADRGYLLGKCTIVAVDSDDRVYLCYYGSHDIRCATRLSLTSS
ncbi:MAG: hypothetical protein JW880_02590 [Candidatus Thermoplasmatota archaeon]|nr:hypothetical protein [Candidatus Thermoplasmatota archaeon]